VSKPSIRIATAQSRISADVRTNSAEIRGLVREARSLGAAIVHFPESAMTGCSKAHIKSWDLFDWDALGDELRALADLAGELGIWVVVGSCHRLTAPHRPHNSLYVVSDRGELVTRYDKQFCSHTEISDWFTPGRECRVFEVGGWRFGCALCIEIQFPEVFQRYEALDVDCVLFSAYTEDPMFGIQAQGYAASHSYWVSVSVPALSAQGLSCRLIGPSGGCQAVAKSGESTLVVDLLDENDPRWEIALHHARPWRARARSGTIYEPLRVDDPRSRTTSSF
jgi:predicted amidohydrolase